jgi:hypothetical protein
LIVGAASQAHTVDGCSAAARDGIDVVELEKLPGRTTMPRLAHERASTAIALPDGPPHMRRNVPVARARAAGGPWAIRGRQLALLELAEERIERPLEHLLDVP